MFKMFKRSSRKAQANGKSKKTNRQPLIDSLEPRLMMSVTYSLLNLGTVGDGMGVYARSINDAGQVCGTIPLGAMSSSAIFRTAANKAINQNTDEIGAAPMGDGAGINSSGQVTGTSVFNTITNVQPFRTTAGGNVNSNNIYIPAYDVGMNGVAIDDSGQVVISGGSSYSSVSISAVNGSATYPTFIAGSATNPATGKAINNAGQVVGWIDHKSGNTITSTDAFIYSGGKVSYLAGVWGHTNHARGINATGQACGDSLAYIAIRHGLTTQHAALFTNTFARGRLYTSTAKDLGTLGGDVSSANAINNAGTIVGTSTTAIGSSATHAFVYVNNTMIDLNTTVPRMRGWVLKTAVAINTKGQIVCQGTYNGYDESCVLSPVIGRIII